MSDYAVINPATGETVKTYPTITDAELEAAIAAGRRGAPRMVEVDHRRGARRADPPGRRAAHRAPRGARRDHRARDGQADRAGARRGRLRARRSTSTTPTTRADFLKDEPIKLLAGDGSALIRRSRSGVLLGIMPWNFPYYQVARFAGPNLIIGNTILLKHAAQCPESAAAMQQIFLDAGFPAGAYVNIYATNDQIATVIADPRVQGVSLTGSERAGAAVAEIAGRHLKKVVLELGGSDPFILLSHRRPRRRRRGRRRGPPRQHRPVLQRGQALHRRSTSCTSRSWRSSPPR